MIHMWCYYRAWWLLALRMSFARLRDESSIKNEMLLLVNACLLGAPTSSEI